MKQMLLILVLCLSSPAFAQNKPTRAGSRADTCDPIGRTAGGVLVYSMKCEHLPVSVNSPKEKEEDIPASAPAEEEDKGGLFRNPFPSIIRPTNIQRTPGVGPPGGGR